MLIRFAKASDVTSSEITPKAVFDERRRFLKTAAVAGAGLAASQLLPAPAEAALQGVTKGKFSTDEAPTSQMSITSYNNFYEFGGDKTDPARNSRNFKPKPWSVAVGGHCEKPGTYAYEDVIKGVPLEERIYRLRCVEAWSMVIPWVGVPLGDVLKKYGPTGQAKYVAFETVVRPEEMPARKRRSCPGRTSRACASTRPCIRWPSWRSASTARSCCPRTARLCA